MLKIALKAQDSGDCAYQLLLEGLSVEIAEIRVRTIYLEVAIVAVILTKPSYLLRNNLSFEPPLKTPINNSSASHLNLLLRGASWLSFGVCRLPYAWPAPVAAVRHNAYTQSYVA